MRTPEKEKRHNYYWLLCKDPDTGKPFLIGGGNTEAEARTKGLEVLGGIDFEVRRLPTRNLARASSMVRGVRLEDTHNLKKASEKLGHTKSIYRMMKRRHQS